jgi:vacuolar-type H+-ATPase subunit F/Vma7
MQTRKKIAFIGNTATTLLFLKAGIHENNEIGIFETEENVLLKNYAFLQNMSFLRRIEDIFNYDLIVLAVKSDVLHIKEVFDKINTCKDEKYYDTERNSYYGKFHLLSLVHGLHMRDIMENTSFTKHVSVGLVGFDMSKDLAKGVLVSSNNDTFALIEETFSFISFDKRYAKSSIWDTSIFLNASYVLHINFIKNLSLQEQTAIKDVVSRKRNFDSLSSNQKVWQYLCNISVKFKNKSLPKDLLVKSFLAAFNQKEKPARGECISTLFIW